MSVTRLEDGAGPLCIGQAAIDSACYLPNPSDLKELILRQLHSTLLYLNRRPYNDPWRWLSLKTGMNLI